jgi:acetyl-CoA C-acetyltransferase
MRYIQPIYVLSARRSPIGRLGGGLKSLGAVDLALPVARAVVPEQILASVDQIILGQVLQAGSGMNIARQLGLRLGVPESAPAFTVNLVCASGLKAIALAADSIALGEAEIVLAGGTEAMSRAPHYATDLRDGRKLGDFRLSDAVFVDGLTDPVLKVAMGETAERIADLMAIGRAEQDRFALASQQRVAAARADFQREIVPLETADGTVRADEYPRPDTTLEKLAALKPAFRPSGTVTAGNASGINDGAALALLANARGAAASGLPIRARLVGANAVGCAPATMGLGPVGAIRRLCSEIGWPTADVDAFEINEAFAVQTLACAAELDLDPAKLNARGGAIALGHPLGCSGARIVVTLLHLMEDRNLRRGIAALCVGGGMGMAVALERELT